MDYAIAVERLQTQPTAVVRRWAKQHELSTAIPQACGEVWELVRAAGLPRPGRLVALYLDCEINFECGVEIAEPFVGNDQLHCSSLPAGLVATTAHIGPYHLLHGAHTAVLHWCKELGRAFAGPSWEVYGHWNEDSAKLRTDVYYLLKE